MSSVPVIDISPLCKHSNSVDQEAINQVYQQIHEACKDIGFFYITGHGVEQSTLDLLFSYTQKFFALPLEKKTAISIHKNPYYDGYIQQGAERTKNVVDIREGFYFGNKPLFSNDEGDDYFPEESDLPGFAKAVKAYQAQLTKLGFTMMKAIAFGLGLPDDYFVEKCSPSVSTLSLWHYPPHPADTDSWGVGPHTDTGMWTFLLQDDVGGLEVEITEGNWVEMKPIPGTFVVNLGDCLQAWTKGLYRATTHRVRRSIKKDRYSVPFFFCPNPECIIEPIETDVTRNLTFTKVVHGMEMPFSFGDLDRTLLEKSHDWYKTQNKIE
ncbi:putative iron/ascorbate oxidoreductase DDB_G0283291 [Oculina patagonica]